MARPAMRIGLGAVLASVRAAYRQGQFPRQVALTAEYERVVTSRRSSEFIGTHTHVNDVYIVTVTNESPTREIVVTRVWFDTAPSVDISSPDLPVRISPEESWASEVPAHTVPGRPADVLRLARCQLSPDNKIIQIMHG